MSQQMQAQCAIQAEAARQTEAQMARVHIAQAQMAQEQMMQAHVAQAQVMQAQIAQAQVAQEQMAQQIGGHDRVARSLSPMHGGAGGMPQDSIQAASGMQDAAVASLGMHLPTRAAGGLVSAPVTMWNALNPPMGQATGTQAGPFQPSLMHATAPDAPAEWGLSTTQHAVPQFQQPAVAVDQHSGGPHPMSPILGPVLRDEPPLPSPMRQHQAPRPRVTPLVLYLIGPVADLTGVVAECDRCR